MGPVPQESSEGKVRWADFLALPDDDKRELVDGRLVDVDVPTILHEWIVSTVLFALRGWVEVHRAGSSFDSRPCGRFRRAREGSSLS